MKRGKKQKNIFGRERETFSDGKISFTKNAQAQITYKILSQQPKIVDLNQVADFEFLYPQKIKKNIKNIVLSGEWMK